MVRASYIDVRLLTVHLAFAAPTSAVGGMPVGRAMLSIDSTIEEIIRLLLVLLSTDELRQSVRNMNLLFRY